MPWIAGFGKFGEDTDGGFSFSGFEKQGDDLSSKSGFVRVSAEQFLPDSDSGVELSELLIKGRFSQANGESLLALSGEFFDKAGIER